MQLVNAVGLKLIQPQNALQLLQCSYFNPIFFTLSPSRLTDCAIKYFEIEKLALLYVPEWHHTAPPASNKHLARPFVGIEGSTQIFCNVIQMLQLVNLSVKYWHFYRPQMFQSSRCQQMTSTHVIAFFCVWTEHRAYRKDNMDSLEKGIISPLGQFITSQLMRLW